MARRLLVALAALALAGCTDHSSGALKVVFIDSGADVAASGERLLPSAQHLRAATRSGLVALDEKGEVVPALADRWIVTDDGLSFIFRLRDGTWPDGREMTAESVQTELNGALRALRGTALGLDLAPISQVRAMAGRVIELRLSSPVPSLLQLLAQPELTVLRGKGGSGPMLLARRGEVAVLTMRPPAARALPEEKDWQTHVRPVELLTADPARAVGLFSRGDVDVVLGGTLGALPLAPTGPLSRGTVLLDPTVGLFGLQVHRGEGFLADPRNREAIAMAIDRAALLAPFNIGGWVATTRVVAPRLSDDPSLVAERWIGRPVDALRTEAAHRVAAWAAANRGTPVRLTLAIARAPGTDILFHELSEQLGTIGITLQRMPQNASADLVLVDRVARYAGTRWFLNQFNCTLHEGLCDPDADALVTAAAAAPDSAVGAGLLAEAEVKLTQANVYIPFGSPLRFSLVRSHVTGFAPNAWAFHPLPPLAVIPS